MTEFLFGFTGSRWKLGNEDVENVRFRDTVLLVKKISKALKKKEW